ncbi:hypothetical protein MNBD_BACTEROID03-316 [hydrothermal vent metagenome]|uniref:HTH araC/xylS-type domain-containing protein n=1 Tax=hydrothermal vent metagenome TaxID=652676 RepID=A0A3B0T4X8_9ZZZZ
MSNRIVKSSNLLNSFRYQIENSQKGVLIERKALLSSKNIELHFYETITRAKDVLMQFNLPVIAVMLQGEKTVEMDGLGKFEYAPGESLIIPAERKLKIDFPSASIENPTQCLAFIPDASLVEEAVYDYYKKTDTWDTKSDDGKIDFSADLLLRDEAILQTVNYLLYLFQEKNEHRDFFINMTTKELIIRILQSKARKAFLNNFQKNENRMTHIANYIKRNIGNPISVQDLSKEANMSKSNFFTLFKNSFGISPNEYIINEKMQKAKIIIQASSDRSIGQIARDLGYSDSSYFCKQFKNHTGYTPRQYERKHN